MATVKISNLGAVSSLNSADVLPTSDTGANPGSPTTYKVTVKTLANSLPQVTSSINAIFATSASMAQSVTGSVFTSTNPALTASFAVTASYALSGNITVFPFSGDAIVSGSLRVTGSAGFTGSVSVINGGFTGSLLGTAATASYTTGSQFVAGNLALSASYSLTASYLNNLIQNLTITGSLTVSGSSTPDVKIVGDVIVTGSLVVSGSNGAGIFSQGATLVDYSSGITNSGSYMVWRAPFSCSVVALYGFYVGGTAPQVNAERSGSSGYGRITGSNILVNIQNEWIPATASGLQNVNFNTGDSLRVVMSGSTNNQLAVQVDFIRRY